jgi:hypothetical protein
MEGVSLSRTFLEEGDTIRVTFKENLRGKM